MYWRTIILWILSVYVTSSASTGFVVKHKKCTRFGRLSKRCINETTDASIGLSSVPTTMSYQRVPIAMHGSHSDSGSVNDIKNSRSSIHRKRLFGISKFITKTKSTNDDLKILRDIREVDESVGEIRKVFGRTAMPEKWRQKLLREQYAETKAKQMRKASASRKRVSYRRRQKIAKRAKSRGILTASKKLRTYRPKKTYRSGYSHRITKNLSHRLNCCT